MNVKLTKLDKRLKSIAKIKLGSTGKIIATRQLAEEPERMCLVKFKGKAGNVVVKNSQVEVYNEI